MKYCPKCKEKYEDEKMFCPMCGTKLLKISPESKFDTVIAVNSEVKGGGDVLAYNSKVEGSRGGTTGNQEVMAVRSKVAGGHIVEGNYVHQSVHINVIGVPEQRRNEEFYLFYLDEKGRERRIRVENEVEIYRRENSWDIVVWDGFREIELGVRDMSVSRRKRRIRIWVENGRFYLQDYGMRSGVYINGRRVNNIHVVSPGDVISVGTLVIRLERNSNSISVKRNSVMFIGKEMAEHIPRELLKVVNGKYYLDASGMKTGEVIRAGDREIVVNDASSRESVLIAKQIAPDMDDSYFTKRIRESLNELSGNVRKKVEKLLKMYEECDEDLKELYKSEIFRILEES